MKRKPKRRPRVTHIPRGDKTLCGRVIVRATVRRPWLHMLHTIDLERDCVEYATCLACQRVDDSECIARHRAASGGEP